eukprot:TRINITY_DN40998_c2_g1_i1.p1 TRINITY_DN40998_c2_g1~~TRINITY_DN40998_c2_g1_i1.p1  ORF type:complete len:205 (-),score=-26.25 TRINITY_DN40998_c2_g1_i1:22-636(-)
MQIIYWSTFNASYYEFSGITYFKNILHQQFPCILIHQRGQKYTHKTKPQNSFHARQNNQLHECLKPLQQYHISSIITIKHLVTSLLDIQPFTFINVPLQQYTIQSFLQYCCQGCQKLLQNQSNQIESTPIQLYYNKILSYYYNLTTLVKILYKHIISEYNINIIYYYKQITFCQIPIIQIPLLSTNDSDQNACLLNYCCIVASA